jgi:tight adherence protein C
MSLGLSCFFIGLAIFLGVYALKAPIHELAAPEFTADPSLDEDAAGRGGFFERIVRPMVHNFLPQTPMFALTRARNDSRVARLLVRSGNPWNVTPEEFYGIRLLGAFVGIVWMLLATFADVLPSMIPMFGYLVVGAAGGYYVPKVLLDRAYGKRKKDSEKGLPEALDMIVITMNSGQNFQPAVAEVVRTLPPGIIRDELARVSTDIRSGKTVERALLDFARRAPTEDVESFCKAIVQAQRIGSDVTQTLRAQAERARQTFEENLAVRIGKLPTTLFFPIIGFMVPAMFIALMAPSLSHVTDAFGLQ